MAKRVKWGAGAPKATDIDKWDRSSQIKPYDGPIPPNSVYHWAVKVLKQVPAERGKLPQLRVGLELVPRKGRPDEKSYKGYFIMDFLPVSPQTLFRYVPFLDAIGVKGRDFLEATTVDDDGNILKIGKWVKTDDTLIAASIKDDADQNGNPRKGIGTYMAIDSESDDDSDEDEESDEEWEDDEEEEYEEDESEEDEEEEDDEEGFEDDEDLEWDDDE